MPTCPHPYDLQSLVDGALGPRELRQAREHLSRCEACAARARELERLHELLLERRVSAPEGLLERILDLLRSVIPVRKLTCRQALELASQYIDDELNELERETLEAHLFACDECFYEYASMRTAAEAMRTAPAVVPSESLRDRILAAVGQEAASPAPAPVVMELPGLARAQDPRAGRGDSGGCAANIRGLLGDEWSHERTRGPRCGRLRGSACDVRADA